MLTAKHLENLAPTSHIKMSADTGRLAKGEYQGQCTLREITDELAKAGFVTSTGKPFAAAAMAKMIAA
jgi:hypothetical protein